jgi:hypothetical protein
VPFFILGWDLTFLELFCSVFITVVQFILKMLKVLVCSLILFLWCCITFLSWKNG